MQVCPAAAKMPATTPIAALDTLASSKTMFGDFPPSSSVEPMKREAVLAAIVAAEGIEPSDDDLAEALAPDAERSRTSPRKLLERIKSAGRLDALREDVAHAKALDVVVDSAKAVPATAEAAPEA